MPRVSQFTEVGTVAPTDYLPAVVSTGPGTYGERKVQKHNLLSAQSVYSTAGTHSIPVEADIVWLSRSVSNDQIVVQLPDAPAGKRISFYCRNVVIPGSGYLRIAAPTGKKIDKLSSGDNGLDWLDMPERLGTNYGPINMTVTPEGNYWIDYSQIGLERVTLNTSTAVLTEASGTWAPWPGINSASTDDAGLWNQSASPVPGFLPPSYNGFWQFQWQVNHFAPSPATVVPDGVRIKVGVGYYFSGQYVGTPVGEIVGNGSNAPATAGQFTFAPLLNYHYTPLYSMEYSGTVSLPAPSFWFSRVFGEGAV